MSELEQFFKNYPKGEIFTALGEAVEILGYSVAYDMAYVIDENGDKKYVPKGLLRGL